MNRRNFLRNTSLASASLMLPSFVKAFSNENINGKKLVIIQLSGGNDGLNSIVPFRNDLYYKYRPGIALKRNEMFSLNDDLAFNSSLEGMASLYEQGWLSIVNSVGYPNPDRSHFRSTDIWQSASASNEYLQSGWIGRYLDSNCDGSCSRPHAAIELDDTLSLALKGELKNGMAFNNPKDLYQAVSHGVVKTTAVNFQDDDHHDTVEYLHKTVTDSYNSAQYIYERSKIFTSKQRYPDNDFAARLKTIAELICSGCDTQVYYVSIGGFDTHALQKGLHQRQLRKLSDALKVFVTDLKVNDRLKETLVLTFSEFGRRVAENGSKGTDHGTANNLFLITEKHPAAGVYNDAPNLSDLQDGDLKYKIDFRDIYATVLDKWIKTDASKIIGNNFQILEKLI